MIFETNPNAKLKFRTTTHASGMTTLDGINPTLASADSICAGVDSLMAIGGNTPYYDAEATRTRTETMYDVVGG